MPRIARICIPSVPHHVIQRGNNRQDIFFVDDDRRYYLMLLREHLTKHAIKVRGYILMTNHIHVIAVPHQEDSLAKAFGRAHYLYTRYINRLHDRIGHLWQNRFSSSPMDEAYSYKALRYIELNPVRAKMVRHAEDYKWSSAAAHLDGKDPSGLLDLEDWKSSGWRQHWKEELHRKDNPGEIESFRLHVRTGRPLGTDSFISKLETMTGRRLRAEPVGRPKKKIKSKKRKINR